MTDTPTDRVRAACEQLLAADADVTFTAVARTSGVSRATCYRSRELRTIIDNYRARHGEQLTLTSLADRVDNITRTLEVVAGRVRRQEEELRTLKRAAATPPAPTQDAD